MIRQPERVIVGTCPSCVRVLVVENNHEVWPYVECACGWGGATTDIANKRRFQHGLDDVITGGGR